MLSSLPFSIIGRLCSVIVVFLDILYIILIYFFLFLVRLQPSLIKIHSVPQIIFEIQSEHFEQIWMGCY